MISERQTVTAYSFHNENRNRPQNKQGMKRNNKFYKINTSNVRYCRPSFI